MRSRIYVSRYYIHVTIIINDILIGESNILQTILHYDNVKSYAMVKSKSFIIVFGFRLPYLICFGVFRITFKVTLDHFVKN